MLPWAQKLPSSSQPGLPHPVFTPHRARSPSITANPTGLRSLPPGPLAQSLHSKFKGTPKVLLKVCALHHRFQRQRGHKVPGNKAQVAPTAKTARDSSGPGHAATVGRRGRRPQLQPVTRRGAPTQPGDRHEKGRWAPGPGTPRRPSLCV